MIFILESQCDELVGVAGGVAGVWSVWCLSAAAEGDHIHLPSKDETWQHTVPTVPAFPTALSLFKGARRMNTIIMLYVVSKTHSSYMYMDVLLMIDLYVMFLPGPLD